MDLLEFYFTKNDPDHLRRVDVDFHDAVCRLSRRTVLTDTLIPLHRKTRRFRRISMEDRARTALTTQEHRKIYEAIVAGDALLAKKLTKAHIANAKEHMLERFEKNG